MNTYCFRVEILDDYGNFVEYYRTEIEANSVEEARDVLEKDIDDEFGEFTDYDDELVDVY